jgi:signal transduction histidine kinase
VKPALPFRNLAIRLLPRRTVRLRLTLVYAALFLASGAVLLAITYVLVRHATGDVVVGTNSGGNSVVIAQGLGNPRVGTVQTAGPPVTARSGSIPRPPLPTPQQLAAQARRYQALAQRQRDAELRQLLEQSGIALAIMAALSIALGWFAAGRVLRPLRTLNERARAISASNLDRRLALTGPDDELKQLANTFDDLLGRLEASFQAQRQFVANASHELRSPLALARTIGEVALTDPEATVDSLQASHRRVLAAGKQQERLIDALLTLARSERGFERRDRFDLAMITGEALATCRPEADRRGVYVRATLLPAETAGDPRLAERLVANLIDNALRHNLPAGGRVDVTTNTREGRAVLSVANSGVPIGPDEVERLFQPFQRLGTERTDHSDGVGLGLSIVQAIATAHDATLTARAQPSGGLAIEISFPQADPRPNQQSGVGSKRRDSQPGEGPVRLRRRLEPRAPSGRPLPARWAAWSRARLRLGPTRRDRRLAGSAPSEGSSQGDSTFIA